jgi:hypothetical protein
VPLISWRSTRPAPAPASSPSAAVEGIDAFVSESALAVAPRPHPVSGAPSDASTPSRHAAAAVKWIAVILATAGATAAILWRYPLLSSPVAPASLTIETNPSGLQVEIGGKPMGVTPLTVALDEGQYPVVVSASDGRRREFGVSLAAGGSVVRHIEMGAPATAANEVGGLVVETEPVRQMVIVDGVERGLSPLTLAQLPPGDHIVQVRTPSGTVRRTIAVEAGKTVSLVISGPASTVVRAGWVEFTSPIVLELRENGSLLGTTASERLMLPAGDHQIELRNDALAFRATRQVTIAADRTVTLPIAIPNGTVSINALPWAEVWIGGQRIGETPIANVSWPIGSHQVLLRHPQLGERKATVTIPAKGTARLGVDMRAP